jgi:hypothetical protein
MKGARYNTSGLSTAGLGKVPCPPMKKQSNDISVKTTTSGQIEISQLGEEQTRVVLVTAEQVDQLVAWLNEGKQEILAARPAQTAGNTGLMRASAILPSP